VSKHEFKFVNEQTSPGDSDQVAVLRGIFDPVAAHLSAVEDVLESLLESHDPLIREVTLHLLASGGKRIRPALVLLCASLSPGALELERVLQAAAAVELVHMATLVHDDVVDEAPLRRGAPTIQARWGKGAAVLTGDFLFARAFGVFAQLDDPHLLKVMAGVVAHMAEAEFSQLGLGRLVQQSEATYLDRISFKTAHFMAQCCRIGAMMARLPEAVIDAAAEFGHNLGMAFQITDDLLDFTGDQGLLGKKAGADLRNGVINLPLLHLIQHSPEPGEVEAAIASASPQWSNIKRRMEENGTFSYVSRLARDYLQRGIRQVPRLPSGSARESLLSLAKFVQNRSF